MSDRDRRALIGELERSLARAHSPQDLDDLEQRYASLVALAPSDTLAQHGLARIRYLRGDPLFARDLAAAAAADRGNSALQLQLASVLRQTGDLTGAEVLLRDLTGRIGPTPDLRSALATVLHEAGRLQEAQVEAIAAVRSRPQDSILVQNLVAVLLSRGRADQAMPLIRAERELAPLDCVWIAHEATAARLLGDPAYAVLYDYDRFVGVYDLETPQGWSSIAEVNAALRTRLEPQHELAARHPLGQSMRSGTQTTGDLLADPDPAIRAVLDAFLEPIADYRSKLGDADDHPLTVGNRGETRYAGCWSVRLGAQGFHVNHLHPEGWLSSAYYVAVPSETEDLAERSGWIKFAEPSLPVPGAGPALTVQPQPGRLVLFPSYMWHGTTAIRGAEPRLTLAFDVVTKV